MKAMVAVVLTITVAVTVFAGYLALRAADDVQVSEAEAEGPGCASPERLRGGESLDALTDRVVDDLFGGEVGDIGVSGTDDPPCITALGSVELELTADSLTSEVAGVAEVRLHDAELRHGETVRAGVRLEPEVPVELDLPEGRWAQATVRTDDGRVLHALVPT